MSEPITLNQILLDQLQNGNDIFSGLNLRQQTVLENIALCGTAYYGFTKSRCEVCGHTEIHYGTCSNPNCPTCGGAKRQEWICKQNARAIKALAFHIIFTVPDKYLNRLAVHDPRFFYNALFKASSKALRKLCRDPKYFGASLPGFFSCLHTWGSTLVLHPHIHTVLYGSGLDNNGNLIVCRKGKEYLFPAKLLAARFKHEMIKILSREYEKTNSPWLEDLSRAKRAKWNVQIQKGLDNPERAINYLGRYVNRTAISNSRIHDYDGTYVTFEYKDYRDHSKSQTHDRCSYARKKMKLHVKEFVRRFALHIPPKRFKRIRFYGFLAPTQNEALERMKELTGTKPVPDSISCSMKDDRPEEESEPGSMICIKCQGTMKVVEEKPRCRKKIMPPHKYLMRLSRAFKEAQIQSVKD